jgi:hypothetical protein
MAESDTHKLAVAIDRNFTSPNVADSNFEAANIVDVMHSLAQAIHHLADAIEGKRPAPPLTAREIAERTAQKQ